MTVAVTSLPVPLSPVTRTVLSLLPMTRRNSKTTRIRALCPTTSESMETACGDDIAITSSNTKRPEVGHLFAQRSLDPDMQRHVCTRAARTNSGEPYHDGIPVDGNELDVATVRAKKRTHPVEHSFNAISGNHGQLQGQCACHDGPPTFRGMRRVFDAERLASEAARELFPTDARRMPLQDGLVFSSWNFSIRYRI